MNVIGTIIEDSKTYWKLVIRASLSSLLASAAFSQMGDLVITVALMSAGWHGKLSLISVSVTLLIRMLSRAIFEPVGGLASDGFRPKALLYYSCILRAITSIIIIILPQGSFTFFLFIFTHYALSALFPTSYKTKLPEHLSTREELLPACFLDSLSWGFVPQLGVQLTALLLSVVRWNVSALLAPLFYIIATALVYYCHKIPKFGNEETRAPALDGKGEEEKDTTEERLISSSSVSLSSPFDSSSLRDANTDPSSSPEDGPVMCGDFVIDSIQFSIDGIQYVTQHRFLFFLCCVKPLFSIFTTFQTAILLSLSIVYPENEGGEKRAWFLGLIYLSFGVAVLFRSLITSLVVNRKKMLDSVVIGFSLSALASGCIAFASYTKGSSSLLLFLTGILSGAAESVVIVSSNYLIFNEAENSMRGRVLAVESALSAWIGVVCIIMLLIGSNLGVSVLQMGVLVTLAGACAFVAVAYVRIVKFGDTEGRWNVTDSL